MNKLSPPLPSTKRKQSLNQVDCCSGVYRLSRMVQMAMAMMSFSIFLLLLRVDPVEDDAISSTSGGGQTLQKQQQPASLFTSNGSYKGTPWKTERTMDVKTVAETKFARCDVHTVQSEDPNGPVINDWVFMEEMDAVNVIVRLDAEARTVGPEVEKFVVFKQGKYGIPGTTLSPVGGFVDVGRGESPFESARREVMEELGVGSRKTFQEIQTVMEANSLEAGHSRNGNGNGNGASENSSPSSIPAWVAYKAIPKMERTLDGFGLATGDTDPNEIDWVFLGRYRTAANRGGGFIYTYLLKNAVPILEGGGTPDFQMSGDDEQQEIHFLTMEEIQRHVLDGHFQEVKWAATIALALLHLQNEQ